MCVNEPCFHTAQLTGSPSPFQNPYLSTISAPLHGWTVVVHLHKLVYQKMDGWMGRWMDGWMGGWMDGWMGG